jgi:ubiquinone/menaquinone biosynthesis C-methylase UbiE
VKAYYHARAGEYDDWWLGRGLYAGRTPLDWEAELEELGAFLSRLPALRTLDVACGTGFLTSHLAGDVTGLDQSDAMLAIARERMPHARFVAGDALALPFADGSFDRVFTSYFYCHLEEPERGTFIAEARRVAPEVVVVGSRRQEDEPAERWEERVLEDGSRWDVFKRVFDPDGLATELGGRLLHASRYFVAVASP